MTGARAPSPVSRPGFSSTAQASFRRLAVLENTRWAAAVTVSAVSEGSAAVTAAARTASGSRSSRSGHRPQRGCPSRSRLVMSASRPQAEQRPSRRAARADRRGDHRGAGLAQREQQVAGNLRGR